jgi:putative membrane protein
MMGEYGWFGPGFGWLFMILVWVLVIAGVVALIKRLGSSSTQPGESPLEILKARYARGEINKQQYERMRRALQE